MRLVKIYAGNFIYYAAHLYTPSTHQLLIIDENYQIFLWNLAEHEEISMLQEMSRERVLEDDAPKDVKPIPMWTLRSNHNQTLVALIEWKVPSHSHYIAVFETTFRIIRFRKEDSEFDECVFQIDQQSGQFIIAYQFEQIGALAFISENNLLYLIKNEEILSIANRGRCGKDTPKILTPTLTLNLAILSGGTKIQAFQFTYSLIENLLIYSTHTSQNFHTFNLHFLLAFFQNLHLDAAAKSLPQELTLESTTQRPLKTLESKRLNKTMRINPYLSRASSAVKVETLNFTYPDECTTASLVHFESHLPSPLSILATNYGRILIVSLFITDTRKVPPVLVVDSHNAKTINNLFIMKNKLVSTSVDGTICITDLSHSRIQKAYFKFFQGDHLLRDRGTVLKPWKNQPLHNTQEKQRTGSTHKEIGRIKLEFAGDLVGGVFSGAGNLQHFVKYPEIFMHFKLVPTGISKIVEIKSLTKEDDILGADSEPDYVTSVYEDSYAEECLALVGHDNSLIVISMNTNTILHRLKGHDSPIIGVYIQETMDYLLILTTKLTLYFYSISNHVLERKTDYKFAYNLFNLDDKILPSLKKEDINLKYSDLLKLNKVKTEPFKRGHNANMDFFNYMEYYQIDFRNLGVYRALTYQTQYKLKSLEIQKKLNLNEEEGGDLLTLKQILVNIFNDVTYIGGELHQKSIKKNDDGFLSIQTKIGKKNPQTLLNPSISRTTKSQRITKGKKNQHTLQREASKFKHPFNNNPLPRRHPKSKNLKNHASSHI